MSEHIMVSIIPISIWEFDPLVIGWLALVAVMVFLMRRFFAYSALRLLITGSLTFIAGLLLITILLPPVARIARVYYRDRDQFQWARELHSGSPETQLQAARALCEIYKVCDSWGTRDWILGVLSRHKRVAHSALPCLYEIDDPDPVARHNLRETIAQLEVEREAQKTGKEKNMQLDSRGRP